jgi:SAM-dependent methyltransferase
MSNEHLGGAIPQGDGNTWMPDVWGYLVVKYGVGVMIDIGCGYGHSTKWFADMGITCVGVDGWREAVANTVCKNVPNTSIVEHDFTKGTYRHGTPFDLAWCAEFLEHLDAQYLPNVAPCFRAARYCVITHGEPEQHGHHHVNCQPDSYWERVFSEWGFKHLEQETKLLRSTDRWNAVWGRRSLMFFERI